MAWIKRPPNAIPALTELAYTKPTWTRRVGLTAELPEEGIEHEPTVSKEA